MSNISPYDSAQAISMPNGELLTKEYGLYINPDSPYVQVLKEHIVKEGETLQSIAYQYYGDSGYWTAISSYNRIINPFSLETYTRLFIPKING